MRPCLSDCLCVEFYPEGNCLWLQKRAMYGLRQAPALWQTHFAKTMISLGFHRCKTDPNLYCHSSKELYVLCYVDDLLVCGNPEGIKVFTEQLSKEVLLKVEGELKQQTTVNFLGGTLRHNGDSIDITMPTAYVSDMLKLFGMENAKPSFAYYWNFYETKLCSSTAEQHGPQSVSRYCR